MKIACVGALDGNFKLYEEIKKENPSWLLCTGDYGVWPNIDKMDKGTRLKNPNQTFKQIMSTGVAIPTVFVAGVHEDHNWLYEQFKSNNSRIVENVYWLANGYKTLIGDLEDTIRITGLGKVYSEKTYKGKFHKKSRRHYTRNDIQKGCSSGPTEILLLHSNPNSAGIRNLIFATRPKLILYSSKRYVEQYIQGVPTFGLPANHVVFFEYHNKMFNCLNDQ